MAALICSKKFQDSLKICYKKQDAFSLAEVLVAITAFAISVTGALSLYTFSTNNIKKSTSQGELNDLVDIDIARARQINENLVCNTGACSISTSTTKDSYFPSVTTAGATSSELANIIFFNSKCISPSGFSAALLTLPGGIPNGPVVSAGSRISRQMIQEPTGHRYTLVYTETSSGKFLRQTTLVPTTVSWCPNQLP